MRPADCVCGTSEYCSLHQKPSDFEVGCYVRLNPYVTERYGPHQGYGVQPKLESARVYRITASGVGPHKKGVLVDNGSVEQAYYHFCWFIADPFMNMVGQALREHDARKADKERYAHPKSR